ncbi:hypothetical protein CPT_Ptah_021 [Stenotrophomonas phage Ptah]|uniref:Uncharacterized protein n=1 Tax=Stenotrophomonas phage Ptah TaxID=2859657 RepID=A0AAE8BJ61_9CAUD|nr:hypothetical protein CPT_Ptah_021 [Stenotrophomonas phage Ptah]
MARLIQLNAQPLEMSLETLLGAQITGMISSSPDTECFKLSIKRVQDSVLLEVEESNPSTPKSLVPVYSVHKKADAVQFPKWNTGWDVRRLDPSKQTPVDAKGGPVVANFKDEADAKAYAQQKNALAHTEVPPPRFYVNNYGSSWAVFDNERKGMPRCDQYVGLFKHNARAAAEEYAKFLNDKVK